MSKTMDPSSCSLASPPNPLKPAELDAAASLMKLMKGPITNPQGRRDPVPLPGLDLNKEVIDFEEDGSAGVEMLVDVRNIAQENANLVVYQRKLDHMNDHQDVKVGFKIPQDYGNNIRSADERADATLESVVSEGSKTVRSCVRTRQAVGESAAALSSPGHEETGTPPLRKRKRLHSCIQ